MELDITRGGFNMLNVFLQENSLKFVWLQCLLSDPPLMFWQHQVLQCFTIPVHLLLQFNLTRNAWKKFLVQGKSLPIFGVKHWMNGLQLGTSLVQNYILIGVLYYNYPWYTTAHSGSHCVPKGTMTV